MLPSRVKWVSIAVLAPAVLIGLFVLLLQLTGNFHEVLKAELYRSAQPSADQITRYVRNYGIRTIINLRGRQPGAKWYRDEVERAEELGVNHIDFGMSASKALSVKNTEKLMALLRNAPRPVLIHCKSGADRTGLVTAIYLHTIHGVDVETAEQQISIRYGHIGVPYLSSTYAMDENWETLEQLYKTKSGGQENLLSSEPKLKTIPQAALAKPSA